jgi:hypothetical protein
MKTKSMILPPDHLSDNMKSFWVELTSEFDFSTEHLHVLRVTAEAFDRIQSARKQIAKDGLMLDGRRHPLVGIEAKSTELFMRGIRDLGLEKVDINAPK